MNRNRDSIRVLESLEQIVVKIILCLILYTFLSILCLEGGIENYKESITTIIHCSLIPYIFITIVKDIILDKKVLRILFKRLKVICFFECTLIFYRFLINDILFDNTKSNIVLMFLLFYVGKDFLEVLEITRRED